MNMWSILAENFDLPILDWIAANLWNPVLDVLMPLITLLGDAGIFWIAIAVVLLCTKKYRKIGLGMAIAMAIGLLVCNVTLKPLVMRPRPYDYQADVFQKIIPLLVEKQHDFSFPSGHTIASFEAATVIAINNKKWGIAALVLAVLIAFSRMYLYLHYPTDVLASVVLGIAFAYLGNRLAGYIMNRFEAKRA